MLVCEHFPLVCKTNKVVAEATFRPVKNQTTGTVVIGEPTKKRKKKVHAVNDEEIFNKKKMPRQRYHIVWRVHIILVSPFLSHIKTNGISHSSHNQIARDAIVCTQTICH